VNTDRTLVLEFLKGSARPLPITSNPLACALRGELIELDAERGTALLAFAPDERWAQGAGVLQGGVLATLLDFAMAFAAHARLARAEREFATATLTVNLLRPAPVGRYLARGRVVREGRKLLFADAELTAASDATVVATASAVLPLAVPDR